MINRLKNSKAGFTLIELMIVVAIIGILSAIAIPQFAAYRSKAYVASMKSDCNAIRIAEEAHFVDNNTYTSTLSDLDGITALSAGNSGAVTPGGSGTIAAGFKVTISDTVTGRTNKTVVYDSTFGTTIVN